MEEEPAVTDTEYRPIPPPPAAPPPAELRRSREDRVLGGVCGGLARYLGVEPALVRVVTVILALASGVGVPAYLVAWVVIPEDGDAPARPAGQAATAVAGAMLLGVGLLMLLEQLRPGVDRFLWPTLLVGAGVAVITIGARR